VSSGEHDTARLESLAGERIAAEPRADLEYVRIVDPETRRTLGIGETGEIHVKGPTLMEGYYKVPRATTFDGEGFFKTGDLGLIDEQGYLHFATRLKDVIKTAGVNVAAVEVEEALARHAGVKAAYVVGVPHPTRGENIVAFVVTNPGQTPDSDELRDFCRSSLAAYKVPRHILMIDEAAVPRTGSGKIEKPTLRREAERRHIHHHHRGIVRASKQILGEVEFRAAAPDGAA